MTRQTEATANETTRTGGVSIRIIGAIAIVVAILLATFAFALAGFIADARDTAVADQQRYTKCEQAIDDLQAASDYLTTQARLFVVTGNPESMRAYLEELNVTNRRGQAVEVLKTSFSDDLQAASDLQQALDESDALAENELTAMRLAAEYHGIAEVPAMIASAKAVEGEQAMSPDDKLASAQSIMLSDSYIKAKAAIAESVKRSSDALLAELDKEIENANVLTENLLFQLRIVVALLVCVIMVLVLVLLIYVLKPLNSYIKRIGNNEPLEASGSYELRYLADAYNTMYEDNSKRIMQLREYAERDPLTGISNRNGYDSFLAKHTRDIALLLIDIDNFKEFNAVYGRDTGNAVLVKLANALGEAFRSTDFPCRIESDLFAVIMTNMNANLREAVSMKIGLVNSIMADDSDDLPLVTFSVGTAFSSEGMTDRDIYDAAESALELAQHSGRNCIAFYGENVVE